MLGGVIVAISAIPLNVLIGGIIAAFGVTVLLRGWLSKSKPEASAIIDRSDPYWLRKELKRRHTEGNGIWVAMNYQETYDKVGFPNHRGRDEACINEGRQWLLKVRTFIDENLPPKERAAAIESAQTRKVVHWRQKLSPDAETYNAPKFYTHEGKTLALHQWAEIKGLRLKALKNRIHAKRWDFVRAIETPFPQRT